MEASQPTYRPMRLVDLARHIAAEADAEIRWRLVVEFLEEYRWEPAQTRWLLLEEEPPTTGDERWDVLLAGLAEHLAAKDGRAAAEWTESRILRRFWFPFNTPVARALALVTGPAALRRRGVFVPGIDLEVA